MSNTAIKVFFLLCIAITSTGCWNNKDINHRLLPAVIGISKSGDDYKIILEIPILEGDNMKLQIIKGTGKSIADAVEWISMNMERETDLLHVKVIVLDKQFAKQGLKDVITGFMRSRDVSPDAQIVICNEDLDHFFDNIQKSKLPTGTSLLDFFEKDAGWSPHIALTRVWQVYRSIHSYTRDVIIPILQSGKNTQVEHIGSAIMKNGKMVGQISPDETLLFNAFDGQGTQGKIEVMDHATVLILNDTQNHKSIMMDEKPIMESELNLKVTVLESKGSPTINLIKNELSALICERFYRILAKTQKHQADIFGLGQSFRTELPWDKLKNWRKKYYPVLKMDFQVNIDIQNEGFLKSD
jgi:Ger(x)C family germination protein